MDNDKNYLVCQSILNGARLVIQNKEELNSINVFPVADGDTGSNLSSLMQSIINNVSIKTDSIKEVLENLSSAALIGARGNSGLIFAQYFSALSENYSDSNYMQMFQRALVNAYESVSQPQEGTILSAIKVWTTVLEKEYVLTNSFSHSLIVAQEATQKAVLDTQYQLPILKKNKLVDSGAKGFYYFIKGFTETYCSQDVDKTDLIDVNMTNTYMQHENRSTEKPELRYCSEFIINHLNISRDDLKKLLLDEGDSLIVVGNSTQTKVHLHTNDPKKILQILQKFGQINYHKVDDMLIQYLATKHRKTSIAIVTDSIADISKSYIQENQIHCIPMNIISTRENFLDKITIDSGDIREKINRGDSFSTSQPSIQTVDSLLSFLENKYDHVLVLTVSAELSGTYQLISQRIKENQYSSDWIQIIDTKKNSVAQGLLVEAAVELAKSDIDFTELVRKIKEIRSKAFIYVSVPDLTPMIKSGRVPKLLGKITQTVSVVPIVGLDSLGKGKLVGVRFNQEQSLNAIMKKIKKLVKEDNLEKIVVAHVDNIEKANLIAKKVKELTNKPCDVLESSAAIAISAGIGSIAIAGTRKREI